MSLQAGELVVRIVAAPGADLQRTVQQQVEGAAKGAAAGAQRTLATVGQRARDMGTKMSLAATLPLLAVAKSATDAASATVEATNKVNVVFGDAADQVLTFSENSAKAFGISRREALGAAGTFGNLFRAMGVGQKQAAKVSTTMTGLAGDLASFNDADPTEVLDALRAGLIGEAEPLRRFGVQLSEARVEAEAFALGLVKPVKNAAEITKANLAVEASIGKLAKAQAEHGAKSLEARKAQNELALAQDKLTKATKGSVPALTDQQKLQARQSAILKDTKLAQGDFQRSLSTSAANQQRVTKALADDAQAAVGEQLLPLYQKAIIKLGEVAEAFGNLSPEARKTILIAAGVVAALGPVLTIFGNLVRVGTGTAKVLGTVGKGASATVGAAKRLAQGYRDAQAAQSGFSGAAGTIGGKLKSAQVALVNGAKAAGRWAADVARAAARSAAAMARAVAAQVASMARLAAAYVAAAARMVASMVATAARVVAAWVLMAVQSLLQAARMAASWLIAMGPVGIIIAVVAALAVVIYKNWDTIKAFTVKAWRAVVSFIVGAWRGIRNAVTAGVGAVLGFLRRLGSFLLGVALAPIRMYLKVWGIIGRGVAAAAKALWSFVSSAFNRGRAIVSSVASAIRNAVVNAFTTLVGAVGRKVGEFVGFVTGIRGKVMGALSGAASWLLQAGRDIVQGLINGVTELAAQAVQKLRDLAGDMVQAVKDKLSIFSPSRVFAELGRFIVQGLVKGLTGSAKDAVAASKKLADMVADAYDQRAKDREARRAKLTKIARGTGPAAAKARDELRQLAAQAKLDKRREAALLALIKAQRGNQVKLARQHDKLVRDLTKARENLAELQQSAREYAANVAASLVSAASITNQLPEGVALTTQALTDRLAAQLEQAKAFGENLARLRALGLNQVAYDQIVQAGVEGGGALAAELAGATAEEIATINALQAELAAQGKAIGTSAADELYGANIKAAQAYVNQLEREEARVQRMMERAAVAFANKVRRELGLAKPKGAGAGQDLTTQTGNQGKGNKVKQQPNGGRPAVHVTVNNPRPERASETVPKRLRRLQQTGALG